MVDGAEVTLGLGSARRLDCDSFGRHFRGGDMLRVVEMKKSRQRVEIPVKNSI